MHDKRYIGSFILSIDVTMILKFIFIIFRFIYKAKFLKVLGAQKNSFFETFFRTPPTYVF